VRIDVVNDEPRGDMGALRGRSVNRVLWRSQDKETRGALATRIVAIWHVIIQVSAMER
jgi:hypothetical protein